MIGSYEFWKGWVGWELQSLTLCSIANKHEGWCGTDIAIIKGFKVNDGVGVSKFHWNREVNWVMGSSSFGYALEYLMIIAGPLWLNTKVTVMTVWFLCFHGEFTVSWDTETTTNASGCSSGAIINHNRHHHGRRHHRHHHARPCKRAVEYCTLQYPYNILCFISGGKWDFCLELDIDFPHRHVGNHPGHVHHKNLGGNMSCDGCHCKWWATAIHHPLFIQGPRFALMAIYPCNEHLSI